MPNAVLLHLPPPSPQAHPRWDLLIHSLGQKLEVQGQEGLLSSITHAESSFFECDPSRHNKTPKPKKINQPTNQKQKKAHLAILMAALLAA